MSGPDGFSIGYVSLQTGLSTHVIRAWERRYHAVTPKRSSSGRRLFTQPDIDRLYLLKQLLEHGHSISSIAGLAPEKLAELTGNREPGERSRGIRQPLASDPSACQPVDWVAECLQAVTMLDGDRLFHKLQEGTLRFSRQALLETVVRPLMNQVGQLWAEGELRIVHGHLASSVVHTVLNSMLVTRFDQSMERPLMLVATPAGQRCYLGALAVAVTVQDHGWKPVLLGYNLPAEEIAAACAILEPQRIALSITCRVDDGFTNNELKRLSELIDGRCSIMIGGQASHHYHRQIDAIGGMICCTNCKAMIRQFS